MVSFFAEEPELTARYGARYPRAKPAVERREILDDPRLHLIVSAAIPCDRAAHRKRGDAPRQVRDDTLNFLASESSFIIT
jgi:hypothetical protein